VPFVVAAPVSTVDFAAAGPDDIKVEHRPDDEVTSFAGTPVAPPGSAAHNPAFDVTPAALVTALVTEHGIARPVNAGTLHDLGIRRGPREGAPTDVSVER
jgi:methylthioribose-1-phosphate isomerase